MMNTEGLMIERSLIVDSAFPPPPFVVRHEVMEAKGLKEHPLDAAKYWIDLTAGTWEKKAPRYAALRHNFQAARKKNAALPWKAAPNWRVGPARYCPSGIAVR